MRLGDALRITHYLYSQLEFKPTSELTRVTPYPSDPDILDTCALAPSPSPDLEKLCRSIEQKWNDQNDIAIMVLGPVNRELAHHLNLLYGIE